MVAGLDGNGAVVDGRVGTLVWTGARPGMLIGKQAEGSGVDQLKSSFDQEGFTSEPRVASMSRSTSMSSSLVSLMPVVEEPGVWLQTPSCSVRD